MKVYELTGAILDYWVAMAEGLKQYYPADSINPDRFHWLKHGDYGSAVQVPKYSSDWSQGGPIIERERPAVEPCFGDKGWYVRSHHAPCDGDQFYGDTLLQATMRAYVASKFGDEVDGIRESAAHLSAQS